MGAEPANEPTAENEDAVGFWREEYTEFIALAARRHVWIGLLIAMLVGAGAVAILSTKQPRFEATCVLRVEGHTSVSSAARAALDKAIHEPDNLRAIARRAKLVERWPSLRHGLLRLKDSITERIGGPTSPADRVRRLQSLLSDEIVVEAKGNSLVLSGDWWSRESAYDIVRLAEESVRGATIGGQRYVVTQPPTLRAEPVNLSKLPRNRLAFVFAVFAGFVATVFAEVVQGRLRDPWQIRDLDVPILAADLSQDASSATWSDLWAAVRGDEDSWRTLAVVPVDAELSSDDCVGVARVLAWAATKRGYPTTMVDATHIDQEEVGGFSKDAEARLEAGELVVIALASADENALTIPVARASDRVLLGIVFGQTSMKSTREAVEGIGVEWLAGIVDVRVPPRHPDDPPHMLAS